MVVHFCREVGEPNSDLARVVMDSSMAKEITRNTVGLLIFGRKK